MLKVIDITMKNEEIETVLGGEDLILKKEEKVFIFKLDEEQGIECEEPDSNGNVIIPVTSGELLDILEDGASFLWYCGGVHISVS
jgi:hypothetical protein